MDHEPLPLALERARRVMERVQQGHTVSSYEMTQAEQTFERALKELQRGKDIRRDNLLMAVLAGAMWCSWIVGTAVMLLA
ncbi:hypothetical protein OKA06_18000 [Novosphingobium sp. MW5]|nr:hypothetical protein [Novosphingobium sp. MW5]